MKDLLYIDDPEQNDSKRYMLISDPHFSRSDVDLLDIVSKVHKYGEEHNCDEIIIGGDISKDVEEVSELILEDVFDGFKIVKGNHDPWDPAELYQEIRKKAPNSKNVFIGKKLSWEEGKYGDIRMSLSHKPQEFKIRSSTTESPYDFLDDIILYGHSHAPFDRTMGEGSIVIGMGSVFTNYHVPYKDNRKMAKRSFHTLDIGESVSLEHYDFDRDILIERSVYRRKAKGFENCFKEIYQDVLEEPATGEVLSYA